MAARPRWLPAHHAASAARQSAGSPKSRRVRIFLAEKGLQIAFVAVDLGKREQQSEAYRAIDPWHVVPTITGLVTIPDIASAQRH